MKSDIVYLPPGPPSPPPNLRPTEVNKDCITLTWDVPESDGGSPITGYVLEKRDMKRNSWVRVEQTKANVRTCKAPKLVEGNQYLFRVCAQNDVGDSDFTTLDEPITAKLPFGKP